MKFSDFLREQKEKHAVLAFGRMNPITSGHEKLVKTVKKVAKEVGGSHHIVLSHSQDAKKNPLSVAQKLKHAKDAFPGTNFVAASKDAPTFFDHAEKLYKQGVTHLHMIAGSDRAGEYNRLLNKYNGTHKGARFNFKYIGIDSSGERDPDAEGVEGMSASKMREAASKGDFNMFKKGAPSTMSQAHAKQMYNDVRKGMSLKEENTNRFSKYTIKSVKTEPKIVRKTNPSGRTTDHVEYEVHGTVSSQKRTFKSKKEAEAYYHTVKEETLHEGVHDKGIFKAYFLGGGPGSGKDYVLSNTLDGHGLTEINSDKALEYLMDKEGLDKRMPDNEEAQRNHVRKRAKNITELRQRLALHGRNGLIINGTGDDPEKYKTIKDMLEKLGYDTHMVMVNTADEVSKARNVERGQRGGRTVPENIRSEKWQAVQNARPQLAKMFRDKYIEFDNSEDLRTAAPEVVDAKKKELEGIFKYVQKTAAQPPKHENAKGWIATELGKKDKAPIRRDTQPHPDSGTHDEMQTNGLEYYGFGRYGKNGKVTHRSLHGRLVPMEKINKTVETHQNKINKDNTVKVRTQANRHDRKRAAKKMNEDFINFIHEAVTVTITGDTAEEVSKTIRLLQSDDEEMTEEDINTMSDPGAFNLLTLGTMMKEETEHKKQKLMIDRNGKPRVFHFRMSAAKEAHRNGGTVAKVGKKYVVKLKEDRHGLYSPNDNAIEATYGQNFTTPSAKELGKVRTSIGRKERPSADKPVAEARRTITLSSIKENFQKKIQESIDKGIELSISMAGAGESPARDMGEKLDKDGKATQCNGTPVGTSCPKHGMKNCRLAELTGDETTASIGDQKEDELKKKGISLTTFKKRNYV